MGTAVCSQGSAEVEMSQGQHGVGDLQGAGLLAASPSRLLQELQRSRWEAVTKPLTLLPPDNNKFV